MKRDELIVESSEPSTQEPSACIAPREGRYVYGYFNSVLSKKDAQRFENHLLFCFRCQEIILALDQLFETLQQNREELFQMVEQEADQQEAEDNKQENESDQSNRVCENWSHIVFRWPIIY